MAFPTLHFRSRRLGAGLLTAVLALGLGSSLRAADQKAETPTLSEKTSTMFTSVKPLWEAKNWDAVLAQVNTTIAQTDPNSYDMAVLLDTKAKVMVQNDQPIKAIEPWEQALQLGTSHPAYFDKKEMLQITYYLANLYGEEGGNSKDPAVQRQDLNKAIDYFERWLRQTPKPTEDAQYYYATLLLNRATADQKNIDKAALRRAQAEIEKGLRMALHPKEQFYILYVYALQQDDNLVGAAEYTELLVKMAPKKKEYWSNLWAYYTNLAAMQKDEAQARAYYARAIDTFDRAQPLGFLKTPKDNYNLITLYYNAGQFRRATELLQSGLTDGIVDPKDLKNWELLAYSYQQINDYGAAIRTYQSAEEHFPDDGNLDVSIAQIHMQLENFQAAYEDYTRAVSKSQLDHRFEVYRSIAYTAFEIGEDKGDVGMYQAALKAMDEASAQFPKEAAKDSAWKQLRQIIQDNITRKAAIHAAVEASQKQR